MELCHDKIGHFGLDKTLKKLENDYWFPQMKKYVKRYIQSCIGCFYSKEPAGRKPGYLHPIEKVSVPMHTLHVDHLGPFVKSRRGNQYLIVAVDAFTKYVFAEAAANTKEKLVEKFLLEINEIFRMSERLISERGAAFTSENFKKFCDRMGGDHKRTAVATPRENGQVERYNRTILDALTASLEDEVHWDSLVLKVVWGLNNTINKSTGKVPAELLLGFRPRHQFESKLLNAIGSKVYYDKIQETRKRAAQTIKENQQEAKRRYDLRRRAPVKFRVGDAVGCRRDDATNDGKSKKLTPRYRGPYEVKKVLERDRYEIGDIKGAQRSQKPYGGVFPSEKLKLWYPLVSSESEESLSEN